MKKSPPVILMAEDEDADVLLIERVFIAEGLLCRIERVENGERALDYFKGRNGFNGRAKHPLPNLFLCDLKMPKVDGFAVIEWLRKQKKFRNLPIVVMTSSNYASDIKRAFDLGANEFLLKDKFIRQPKEFVEGIRKFILG